MAFPAQGETTNHLQPSHFYVGEGGGREFVRPIPIISLLRRRRLHFSYTVRSFSSCLSARVEGGPADEPTQARSTIERWSLRWTFRPTKRTNQPTSQRTRSHKRLNFPFSLSLLPLSHISSFFLWRGWLEAPWRFSLPPHVVCTLRPSCRQCNVCAFISTYTEASHCADGGGLGSGEGAAANCAGTNRGKGGPFGRGGRSGSRIMIGLLEPYNRIRSLLKWCQNDTFSTFKIKPTRTIPYIIK